MLEHLPQRENRYVKIGVHPNVEMAPKQTWRILSIIAASVALAASLLILGAPTRPPVSMAAVSYGKRSSNRPTWAHIDITNSGRMIMDKTVRFSGKGQLRVELPTGFKTNDIGM